VFYAAVCDLVWLIAVLGWLSFNEITYSSKKKKEGNVILWRSWPDFFSF
jgi:hypothetical protein